MEGMTRPDLESVMPSTVHLVDGSLYVFRAWHSMPDEFFDAEGQSINAVHGFTRFLCELLERAQPDHIAVAFDASLTSSFRNAIYPAYKANRELPPPSLERQFVQCRAVTEALGICMMIDHAYEADDLIGSTAWNLRMQGWRSIIVSADKDFGQLLGEHDEQWDYARNLRWGPTGVHEKLGVHPHQVADYLALCGDAIDNIPGVPGVGAKTAAALLTHFGSLDSLLERIDEVPFLRVRGAAALAAKLRSHAEQARLSQRLACIALDAPVPGHPDSLLRRAADLVVLDTLCERLRIGPLTRERARKLLRPESAA
jgi:5'-3' exonuclease